MFRFTHPSAPNTRLEQKPEQSRSISLKKALAIGAVPLLLLFGAAFQSSNSVPGQLQAIQSQLSSLLSQNSGLESQISGLESQNSALQAQVTALANKGARKFYLTTAQKNGADASTACAVGYHMASLWEINDPSNLRYDKVLGQTLADSGSGPTTTLAGWIRTGNIGTSAPTPGTGNCNSWQSADAGHRGTIVQLPDIWTSAAVRENPWVAGVVNCSAPVPVWCVQD